ncbi:LptE family protein [Bacteroidota bacterium]
MNLRVRILHSLKQKYRFILMLLLIAFMMVNLIACCVYSFTGSSVPGHLKTIAIPITQDRSGAGVPGLREMLTQELMTQFIDDNSLQVTERTLADALLECTIISFSDAPSIVAAGESVEQRRVTITVQVIYKDLVKKINIFDNRFSNYGDYQSGTTESLRIEASEVAVNKIAEDILLAVVSGW